MIKEPKEGYDKKQSEYANVQKMRLIELIAT